MASSNGQIADPTQLQIAKGNTAKKDLDLSTEAQPDYTLPEIPSWLSPGGREEWERLGPILLQNKLITVTDGEGFATFCSAVARRRTAETEMNTQDLILNTVKGGKMRNPLLVVIRECDEVIFKYSLQFGLTPAARAKIKFPSGTFPVDGKGKKGNSEMDRFKAEQEAKRKAALGLVQGGAKN